MQFVVYVCADVCETMCFLIISTAVGNSDNQLLVLAGLVR